MLLLSVNEYITARSKVDSIILLQKLQSSAWKVNLPTPVLTPSTPALDRIAADQMHDGTLVHWQYGHWGWPKNLWAFAKSKHVICLHLDTLITAFLTEPLYLCVRELVSSCIKETMYVRRDSKRGTGGERVLLEASLHLCMCVANHWTVWDCGEPIGIYIRAGNRQNSENSEPWVSSEVAQPNLRLMGWMGCGLFLPDHMECYLSVSLTDHLGRGKRWRQEGWKDSQGLQSNVSLETEINIGFVDRNMINCWFAELWDRIAAPLVLCWKPGSLVRLQARSHYLSCPTVRHCPLPAFYSAAESSCLLVKFFFSRRETFVLPQ